MPFQLNWRTHSINSVCFASVGSELEIIFELAIHTQTRKTKPITLNNQRHQTKQTPLLWHIRYVTECIARHWRRLHRTFNSCSCTNKSIFFVQNCEISQLQTAFHSAVRLFHQHFFAIALEIGANDVQKRIFRTISFGLPQKSLQVAVNWNWHRSMEKTSKMKEKGGGGGL